MIDAVPARAESAARLAARRARWTRLAIGVGEAALIAVCLFIFLRGWARDFSVPISFSSDTLLAEMQSKSTVDNGWWWFNPKIGAPFGLDELQFPANSNVDQAIVWIVSRIVHEPATAINLAWLMMVVLSGLTATWGVRTLGISTPSAVAVGALFALSPYALYRQLDHFWMVIYLVPFVCTAGLLLASGFPERWHWGMRYVVLLAGCTLIGFNYVYYAFFGCFILIVASAIGCLQYRHARVLVAGFVCLALIGGATVLNLAPSVRSWQQHGKPLLLRDKVPAESELYGLKIRQLVSPSFHHRFPPFRAWIAKEQAAAFPLETENMTSRLGVVATLGFLGLLGLLFVPRLSHGIRGGDTLLAASRLTLAALLLATIGGFGSLVSLLITPEIRAYNRIAPFIAFFSLVALALVIDSWFKRRWRRIAAAVVVAAIGLADQRAAAVPLNASHLRIAAEVSELRSFVRDLEVRLPVGAMVFQLPLRTYLNDEGVARMQPYDHLKLYLMSRTLRWSYPALTNQQVRWQQAAATLDPNRLAHELAAEGFSAILIDRYGYKDNGAAVVAGIQAAPDRAEVLSQTVRYIVLDIRRLAQSSPATSTLAKAASSAPVSTGLAACEGQPLLSIDRVGWANAPFGAPPRLDGSADIKVSGWAVDQNASAPAGGVDVVVDQVAFQTIYGRDRSDVAAYFKRPNYLQSGFLAAIPKGQVARGTHTLALRVVSADAHCYYESPGQTLVVD